MKISIVIAAFLLILTGCSKRLDIQPTQSIDEKLVFTTDANIKAALNGAYDVLSGGSLLGGELQLYSELLGAGGEIRWMGTYTQPREIYNKSILTNNSYIRASYAEGYRLINICNNIIENINVADESDRGWIKGEALLLRGWSYFEMVKLFSKPYSAGNVTTNLGLQIVTVPTIEGEITEANKVPRSTIQQTYDQIISDLTTSQPLLGDDIGVYASQYLASALLSRVYLQTGNYAAARDEANDVIENSDASLEPSYANVFNRTSPSREHIFVLPVTAQDGANYMHLFWSTSAYGARKGDVEIRQAHLNLYEEEDDRLAFFFLDRNNYYRSGKWQLQYKYLPLVRLAEMYLTRAECNFRLSTTVGNTPAKDINDFIRHRAGLDPEVVTLDKILLERKLELAHEGQRIHDIKRLKQSVDGFTFDDNKLVLPIPSIEINAGNGVLEQNPGYF